MKNYKILTIFVVVLFGLTINASAETAYDQLEDAYGGDDITMPEPNCVNAETGMPCQNQVSQTYKNTQTQVTNGYDYVLDDANHIVTQSDVDNAHNIEKQAFEDYMASVKNLKSSKDEIGKAKINETSKVWEETGERYHRIVEKFTTQKEKEVQSSATENIFDKWFNGVRAWINKFQSRFETRTPAVATSVRG